MNIHRNGLVRSGQVTAFLFGILLILVSGGWAVSETRQHGVHVHGMGKLNVAMESNELYLELISPAANIVGFEHKPETEKEKQTVEAAMAMLEKGDGVFIFTKKAECRLQESHIKGDVFDSHHEEHDEHHDGKEDKHDDHHTAKEDKHDHHHADEAVGHDDSHSEIEATYRFRCARPENLKSIDVQLFSQFPMFEELDVQLLTTKGQTAVELSAKEHILSL